MNRKVVAFLAVSVILAASAGAVIYVNLTHDGSDIRVACGTKNCYEPIWIADGYGLFDREGVDAELLYVDGGGSAVTAILDGTADMTIVGADPAVRMMESGDGYVLGVMQMPDHEGELEEFAYVSGMGIDLNDASSLLNPDGTVRVRCGLDMTTGYRSGYVSYLHGQLELRHITEEQYDLLRTEGIVNVESCNQAASLLSGSVQMICGGNTVAIAGSHEGIETGHSPGGSVIGTCYVICSKTAYEDSYDSIVRVLRALDTACWMIEDPSTSREMAEFCADYYGSESWTADTQERFFGGYYWDVCICTDMSERLEFTASVLDYEDRDYSDRMADGAVRDAHSTVHFHDGLYLYDSDTGGLIEA